MEKKKCTKCKIEKELTEYHKHKNGKNGLRATCKVCNKIEHQLWVDNNRDKTRANSAKFAKVNRDKCNAKLKRYRKKYPEKEKSRRLKKRYGITLDDYNDMLKNQNECCDICKKHKTTWKIPLNVDHCHTTGKVRGLLCGQCNRGIGIFEDNPDFLENAKKYLEKEK